ncbi:acyl-CoA thioesterase [uncultured Algibacter sp.]|uniref:acyl-CoA thioesterase n=1 Tax=uncultured Algibacter sp. TaxID=298659 RepID=UPI00262586F6|nr:acyl-CoA thioesterase [uncultured Algibacter sp.]
MNQLPKVLESKTKIRFQDCDPFNHLNNGSYINYFMNHREDVLIKDYNLDIYKKAKLEGKSWVSISNQIAYLKPALLMETVVIESQLIKFDTKNLLVEMRMYNEEKTHIKSIIWSGFAHFNLVSQKREIHSTDLLQLFKNVYRSVDATIFETRFKQLKPNLI